MRLVVGSALVVRASPTLWGAPPVSMTTIASACLAGSGILLIPGLWTPIAGALVALVAIWQILTLAGDPWISLLAGTIGGGLAMVGPGFWSVDAYLFGWKRVVAPNSHASFAQALSKRPPNDLAAGPRGPTGR
jgi:hypothetical protein